MVKTKISLNESIFSEQHIKPFFELAKAYLIRGKISFTVIFIKVYDRNLLSKEEQIRRDKKIEEYLQSKIRESDLLFNLTGETGWGIILSQCGEKEADAFIQRVVEDVKNKIPAIYSVAELIWSVAEIANGDVDYEELIAEGKRALRCSGEMGPWNIEYIPNYKEKKVETVKVSIIDSNELLQEVLTMAIERITSAHLLLDIKTFNAGDEFLDSDFYLSSHRHIVIMNDILPRKNGFDILKTLRSLPNDKRFTIFMVTKRNSEEDMISAYKNGADGYLVRPFSIKLFEAQMQRIMERL